MSPAPAAAGRFPGFEDASVVVTGGASGIGRAVAELLARSGARVVVGDLDTSRLADIGEAATAEGLDIVPFELDVCDPSRVAALIRLGDSDRPLRGLVCSAGVAPDTPVLDIALHEWERLLSINLTGTFLVCQAAARAMCASGAGGAIVNVSSASQTYGAALLAHYNASKAGVVALSKTMARASWVRTACASTASRPGPSTRRSGGAGFPTAPLRART